LPKDKDREIVIYWEHGQRAWMANKLLAARGYRNTTLRAGYLEGWKKAGLPLEK
jgi:rhodanese-related sulfurtransferase